MTPQLPTPDESALEEVQDKVTEPPLYKVWLHNDDFTTKEFVVQVLVAVFNKSVAEAADIMWTTHRNGVGLCGIFPFEIAETKVNAATEAARENGFPLKLSLEEI